MSLDALDDVVLIASSARDAPVVAFDSRTGAVVKHYNPSGGAGGGALAAVGSDRIVQLCPEKRALWTYGVEKESCERASVLPERPMSVCASRDGRFVASGTASGTASAWEASTGRLLARFRAHFKGVTAMTFTPCGSALVTGGEDGAVHA